MNDQINITEILDMLIRRWWIWTIAAIGLCVVTFIYTEVFVDPLYSTDGTLYVNAQQTQSNDVTSGNQAASKNLVSTYRVILVGRSFLANIANDLDGRYSVDSLKRMISMEAVNGTEVLRIKVTGKVPEDVYAICHSMLEHAPDELIRVVEAGSVKILDDGRVPTSPVSPNTKKNVLVAALVGMVLGGLIILVLELFDTRIKSRDDIVTKYDEPLLGEIPEVLPMKVGEEK